MIDYLAKGRLRNRGGLAFVSEDQALSYEELAHISADIARAVASCGLSENPRCAVYSPNDPRAFACILGIFSAGGTWIPTNARNALTANASFLGMAECELLFFHSTFATAAIDLASRVPSIRQLVCIDQDMDNVAGLQAFIASSTSKSAPIVPDDPDRMVTIFPTGGTTGLSKGAVWSQCTWNALISAYWHCLPSDAPPVHLVAGPMTHAAGALALMMLPGGASNICLKNPTVPEILRAIAKHRITHLYLPPTMLYQLLADPDVTAHDFSSLEYFVLAGSAVAPEKLREAIEVFGAVMCQSFGQAEAPMFATYLSTADLLAAPEEGADRFASCGRATLNVHVEIMSEDGALLGVGERGEIVVRGDLVSPGYFRNEAATAAVSTHGWHHTGDVGFRDDRGFVYIVDRLKDMIVTGGFNVFSAEVEKVLLGHPAVQDCVVIGVPDPKWGEAVKAIVELKRNALCTPEELIGSVKSVLGSVQAPKSIDFWPELPRSGNGKVLKREVRAKFWDGRDRAI